MPAPSTKTTAGSCSPPCSPESTRTRHEPPATAPHPARPAARTAYRRRQPQRPHEAADKLARLRTASWLGDSWVRLHTLASLIAQAERLLPQAVHDARDQDLTWTQIGELLGTTAATAARRYGEQAMTPLTRITGIMPKPVIAHTCPQTFSHIGNLASVPSCGRDAIQRNLSVVRLAGWVRGRTSPNPW
jgi:hypothetical protein